MVDVAIDLILVDMLGKQLADDEEYLRTTAVEGETARIGHHTTIDGDGESTSQLLEATQLPNDTEHQLAGAGSLGLRDGQVGIYIGFQMVVDENLTSRTLDQSRLHILDTTSKWFGVTYAADREETVNRIQKLVDEGVYPNKLF